MATQQVEKRTESKYIMGEFPIYLAGNWVTTSSQLEVTYPYDGSVVAYTYQAGKQELDKAITKAQETFYQLSSMPSFQRANILQHVASRLRENKEDIARTITLEAGKPIKDARVEVDRAILTFTLAAEEAKRIHGEVVPLDLLPSGLNKMGIVRRFPIGPVAAISPFNFPLNLAAHKVAPAIAVGNPVVLKPPSKTPITWLKVARFFEETDLPEGALSVLPMDRNTGDLLVSDERIKLLTFTGSDVVGWELKKKAGKKNVILELGGNAGVVVDKDADIEHASRRLAYGSFAYAGQICISVQRIFVHKDIYEDLKTALVEQTGKLKVGDPLQEDTDVSPLIDNRALDRVESWVQEAVQKGAKVVTGGKRNGNIFEPTILENVPEDARVCSQEAFAPVVIISPVESFEDGLRAINRSRFGLQAGVFTNDISKATLAFNALEVGGVVVNDVPTFRVDNMPYGGVKDSGLGREGIRYAIEHMTEYKIMILPYDNRDLGA
mgnify:CR=1 FL=1